VLEALDQPPREVTVVLVGLRTMQSLNSRYRGKRYPTDVLSFDYGQAQSGFLGEVVIAPEVARRQAERAGARFEGELRKLLVHGLLHLLGYDHETDRGEMDLLQARLLARRRIRDARLLVRKRASRAALAAR
jgi:probable rRNA maturation factor